jgi:methylene-tetrahydromethanopterin dehydrogenase
MEKPFILHLLTPARHASPFDVNMACDAGYDVVVPYANVGQDEVASLTQDAIFSRGPKRARRTGHYIGGRDIGVASDMLKAAVKAMVPPFEVSVFADPSGAFTTAAAMIACVERQLRRAHQTDLRQLDVLVLGGTGPVGAAAAVLATEAGARATIVSRRLDHARATVADLAARYGTAIAAAQGGSETQDASLVRNAAVVLACGAAGARLLTKARLEDAASLLVVADVNAVPPAGVEGVGVTDDGVAVAAGSGKAVGIGALAIGNVKYQTQRSMLETMRASDKAIYLDLRDALASARKHVS